MTGFYVPPYTIQTLLRDINPEGTESRRRQRLRRRVYSNPGPNYAWHIDGHNKLKPFGFSVHGAIDGYSRKVLWLKVLRSNNSPSVIGGIYLDCVKEMEGCPTTLVTDLGTENVLVAAMQTFFRQGIDGHQYVRSPRNQRIESWWSFFTKTKGNWWKHFFLHLETEGVIDMTSAIDKECLWFCFSKIIQKDFDVLTDHWNSHRIRKSRFETIPGRPNVLCYLPDLSGGATDLKLHVSDQQVYAVLGYVSPDNNVLNEYQEYFASVIRRLQLDNPSNYQHALQLFGVLKDAALNGIP